MNMTSRPKFISIPAESNFRYLPLVYFLPEKLISKCPTLYKLPRKVRDVLYDSQWQLIVESDVFLKEIMDAAAALAFPHFGFSGWKEHYTGYCPVWQLTYALPLWAKLLADEIGWDLQALMLIPSREEIPFFDTVYIEDVMRRVVERGTREQNWQPILDVVREMPCDEDFEKIKSNVRKDFIRKWYHTRSKYVKSVSLEECLRDSENAVYNVPDLSQNLEAEVIAKDSSERFLSTLSERDRQIAELRHAGYTYEEVAERLGYANHSGVIKRMRIIEKKFKEFQKTQ